WRYHPGTRKEIHDYQEGTCGLEQQFHQALSTNHIHAKEITRSICVIPFPSGIKKTALHHTELFFNCYVQLTLLQPLPSVPCLLQ
ncbi:MAG: hypothetical protein U0K47_06435, partial [Erysipelotrichaceae bacterium]|nr:hypothetical protein [Erysipelotrichaceae bacterium]